MKRILTLFMGLAAVLFAQAQDNFLVQFADKEGNVIADGTTLTITDFKTDDFGDVMVAAGIYAKNTTAEPIRVKGKYSITQLPNGTFQTCFPDNCISKQNTGSYETQEGILNAQELKNMMTEWLPAAEGTCKVTYQICYYAKNDFGREALVNGPTVILNLTYNTTGITGTKAKTAGVRAIEYFDLTGRQISTPSRGVCLRRIVFNDGTTTTTKYQKK